MPSRRPSNDEAAVVGCEEEEEEDEWVDGEMVARFVSRMAQRMDCTSSRWVRRASWSMGFSLISRWVFEYGGSIDLCLLLSCRSDFLICVLINI